MCCAVCGEHEARLRYQVRELIQGLPGEWWFVTCRRCGHGYLSPRPSDQALGDFYAALWTPENLQIMQNVGRSGFEKALIRSRLAAIRRLLGDEPLRALLDVGCGLGFFLRALHAEWPEAQAMGVELNAIAAERAERPDITILRRPYEQLELPDGSLDLVTMIHFLEHQVEPGIDVERAQRLLAPGGLLLVEVPRLDGWGRSLFRRWYWPHIPPQHLQLFSRRGLVRLLRERGFGELITRSRSSYPMLASTSLVLASRYTFGSRSPHKDRWILRGPLMALGFALLPFTLAADLLLAPLLNLLGFGDILLVVGRKAS